MGSVNHNDVAFFTIGVTKMLVDGGLAIIQRQDGKLMTYNCLNGYVSHSPISDANIGTNSIISLFYVNNRYYLLFSAGFLQLNIISMQYQNSMLMFSLPNNNYKGLLGLLINILYVPNTPFIYKGSCDGQNY
jgi:hypothetical protein